MAVVLSLLPLMVVAAFSGSPAVQTASAPSGVADISGSWSGTSDWEQHSVHAISGVTVAIDQDGRSANGTLAFTSPAYQGWSGRIRGTLAGEAPDTQFVGTIELRAPATTQAGTCVGNAVFAGRSVSTSLRWDTSQMDVRSSADGEAAAGCRGLLRRVVLILERN